MPLAYHLFFPLFSFSSTVVFGGHLEPNNTYAESLTAKHHAAPTLDISMVQSLLTASYGGITRQEVEQVPKKTIWSLWENY